ncbi:hypothetical protein [Streptomyces europaeiscabiei]
MTVAACRAGYSIYCTSLDDIETAVEV